MPKHLVTSILEGRHYLPFASYNLAAGITSDRIVFIASIDRTTTFITWTQALRVDTTNNGSHYWTIGLYRMDGTLINSMTTAAISASTWTSITDSTWSISSIGIANVGCYVAALKTGSPGFIDLGQPIIEVGL